MFFVWFSYGFPMLFYGFLWLNHHFSMVFTIPSGFISGPAWRIGIDGPPQQRFHLQSVAPLHCRTEGLEDLEATMVFVWKQ